MGTFVALPVHHYPNEAASSVLSRILGATEAEELIGDEETEGAPSERAGFQQAPNHVTDL